MYLRTTQRRNKDGSVVRYVQVAHNRRVGGATRAKVLLNLGREDQLDAESLRRLAQSITRYLGSRSTTSQEDQTAPRGQSPTPTAPAGAAARCACCRAWGLGGA